MYTVDKSRPVNPITLEVLAALHAVAAAHQIPYFVIGAMARDLLMTYVFGIDAGRATRDVDFAIALEDWSQFEVIKQAFIDTGIFQSQPNEMHRLYYDPVRNGSAYPLDLIPFGKIASATETIAWPPDMAVIMNVAGYKEALQHATRIDVGAGLIINVISIPALVVLKILAWNDRGLEVNKDAQDLLFLLRHYHEAGNTNRLYEEAISLMESCGFAIDLAGAALLGYDTSLIVEESTRRAILGVLDEPVKRDRLTIHMSSSTGRDAAIAASFIDQFERGLKLGKL